MFILAGGKSSRMGKDKGLVLLNNIPVIQHIINEVKKLDLNINIITDNHSYNTFGCKCIKDIIPGQGPLGGLYTAMCYTTAEYILLLSCDMPFVTYRVFERLINRCRTTHDEIIACRNEDNLYPFPAFYHVSLKEKVKHHLDHHKLKMQKFIQECSTTKVDVSDMIKEDTCLFSNLNTPSDIKNAERKWKQKK